MDPALPPIFVLRGGIARPEDLIAGTRPLDRMSGISGFSVQCWPGISVDDLAREGRFPNRRISVARYAAILRAGFEIVLSTPGRGRYHATVAAPFPLPIEAAVRLSQLFVRRTNPWPVLRGGNL